MFIQIPSILALKHPNAFVSVNLPVALEEAISKNRELTSISEAKSAFIASVSHEIRTPLNGMIGMLQLLQRSPLDPQQKKYLDILQDSSATLLQLINAFTGFSFRSRMMASVCPQTSCRNRGRQSTSRQWFGFGYIRQYCPFDGGGNLSSIRKLIRVRPSVLRCYCQ